MGRSRATEKIGHALHVRKSTREKQSQLYTALTCVCKASTFPHTHTHTHTHTHARARAQGEKKSIPWDYTMLFILYILIYHNGEAASQWRGCTKSATGLDFCTRKPSHFPSHMWDRPLERCPIKIWAPWQKKVCQFIPEIPVLIRLLPILLWSRS